MRIAIISDTHLPRGERRLPGACVDALKAADLIIHAGDFMTLPVYLELRKLGELVAVHGNVDSADLRRLLPERRIVDAHDSKIAIVHDAGPRTGRIERLRSWFPEADVVIFGHSHMPLHETDERGFQIFNPGSPTERRRAERHTMGIAEVAGGEVTLRLVPLD